MLFKKLNLKRFIEEILIEINPRMNVGVNTLAYFPLLFNRFILEKDTFEYWKIQNDHVNYRRFTETMKNDQLFRNAWDS